jgi:hypothetical protein
MVALLRDGPEWIARCCHLYRQEANWRRVIDAFVSFAVVGEYKYVRIGKPRRPD